MKEKMGIFFRWNVIISIFIIVCFFQKNVVGGTLNCGGIFKGETAGFEYHRKNSNSNVDELKLSGSSVCVWMIKLLPTDGAGISLKIQDLDENSVVNFYAKGEPTDSLNTPITRNSTQINSPVELSGQILIIKLKSQIGFGNASTKFVVSWNPLDKKLNFNGPSSKIPIQPVKTLSTNYFAGGGGEKGWYNFKSSHSFQKSVRILDVPEPPIKASICPNDSTISPCTCTTNNGLHLICKYSAVNQMTVENAIRETRRVNGIPEDRGIDIYRFDLLSTNLADLHMAPFYGSRMNTLFLQNNLFLTKLVTSGNPKDHESIRVNTFYVESSPLNRDGFGDVLKYFSNEMIDFLANSVVLDNNNNNPAEGEFIRGLSAHTNLTYLSLHHDGIAERLNADIWNFNRLPRLQEIDLSNNRINEIGENMFNFGISRGYLEINLIRNRLNEFSFHPNSGIARAGRPIELRLKQNQIASLPALIFETFLDAHPQNVLSLSENPLICDEGLIWIKARQKEFQSRVEGADCSNDPGHTVFDSSLIPIIYPPPISASLCPDSFTISPCICSGSSQYGVLLKCEGVTVTQTSIENGFREIRQANGIPEGRGIHFDAFLLQNTKMTKLDMKPFSGSRMDQMEIRNNPDLSEYEGNSGSIHVYGLNVWYSPLKREGFGNFLKYFTNDMTEFRALNLDLSDYNSNDQSEFLPGFSALTNLSVLHIKNCEVSGALNLERWNFKRFAKIKEIHFGGNRINGIGENVFGFDLDHDYDVVIDLSGNQIKEFSIHPNSGISRTDRKLTFDLSNNQITTLPAPIFETFLDAHSHNFLSLTNNPLICDQRLSWIKRRAYEFVYWVENPNCKNDPGHTVFDSNLIP